LKILVFIKAVPDVRVPVEYEETTGRLRREWGVAMLNPPDRSAIETAITIRSDIPGSEVTVVHLGDEDIIRQALALGCDHGVCIRDEGLQVLQPGTKALIFARVARVLGFDLILTGARSQDTGNGQTGILVASDLAIPCITQATALNIRAHEGTAAVTKRLAQGYHQLVESPMPLLVAMEALGPRCLEPTLSALLKAGEKEIESFDLTDLGIPMQLVLRTDRDLAVGPLRLPQSKLRFIPAPDSSLPAFMRIRRLVEGTVKTREGRLVDGPEDDVVEDLFSTLLKGGWLDHLRLSEPGVGSPERGEK
jgi:electron transfer flavoprotein beta subunit